MWQMGIYTVQAYLLYYIKYAVPLPEGVNAETALSLVMLPLQLCALLSPLAAGWISDRAGGAKKVLLISGGALMVCMNVVLALTRHWPTLPWLSAVFGAGYGTFNALDFALAMDVLPGGGHDAGKDLGLWNLAMAIPMCVAAPTAGYLLDTFNRSAPGGTTGYTVLFLLAAAYLAAGIACVLKIRSVR